MENKRREIEEKKEKLLKDLDEERRRLTEDLQKNRIGKSSIPHL